MSIYYRIYGNTGDGNATTPLNSTYATVRNATTATVTTGATASVQHSFATPNYVAAQIFYVFDTSTIPAGNGSGSFNFRVTSSSPSTANTDRINIREVTTVANKIAGASLSGLTLHAGPQTWPAFSSVYTSFPVLSVASVPRSSTFRVVVHSEDEETNTAPTGTNFVQFSTADESGTTQDPYLNIAFGTPWTLVGVGTNVVGTATPLTLTEPAGVQEGDLLIACITYRYSSIASIWTNAAWTQVGIANNNFNTSTNTSAQASAQMFYIVRGASAPSLSFAFSGGGTLSVAMGQIVAYRGNAQTTPLDDDTGGQTATNTTAVSVAGLTTTQDDDLIVAMCAGGQEASWSNFNNTDPGTWNSADKSANITLSNGDKTATTSTSAFASVQSITKHNNETAGKYYAEFKIDATSTSCSYGIQPDSAAAGSITGAVTCNSSNGAIQISGSGTTPTVGATPANNDIICMAWDSGAERIWFRLNGGLWNNDSSANPATGTNGFDIAAVIGAVPTALVFYTGATSQAGTIRNNPTEFTQAIPSGFAAWTSGGALTASGSTDPTTAPSTTTWIERADTATTTGADTSLAIIDAVRTGTGATGNLTATASLGAAHAVVAGAFKIAPPPIADAWNYKDKSSNITLSNSDKTATADSGTSAGVRSSTSVLNGTAGKYYAELLLTTRPLRAGLSLTSSALTTTTANMYVELSSGNIIVNNSATGISLGGLSSGDILSIAWDTGAELVWFRQTGGNWNNNGSANPASGTSGIDVSYATSANHALWAMTNGTGQNLTVRTEAAEFTETPPSGFTSWMGEALSAPATIVNLTTNLLTSSIGDVVATGYSPHVTVNLTTNLLTASVGDETITAEQNVSINVTTAGLLTTSVANTVRILPVPLDAWDWQDATTQNFVLSDSDKTIVATGSVSIPSETAHSSGLYYTEVTLPVFGAYVEVGIFGSPSHFAIIDSTGAVTTDGGTTSVDFPSLADGDVIGIALDAEASKVWFRVNGGDWNNNASYSPGGAGGVSITPAVAWKAYTYLESSGDIATLDTTKPFASTKPSGYADWYSTSDAVVWASGTSLGLTASITSVAVTQGTGVSTSLVGEPLIAYVNDVVVNTVTGVSVTLTGESLSTSLSDIEVYIPPPAVQRSYIIGGPLGSTFVVQKDLRSYILPGSYVIDTYDAPVPPDAHVNLASQVLTASTGQETSWGIAGEGAWDSSISLNVILSQNDRVATGTGVDGVDIPRAYSENAHSTGKYYVEFTSLTNPTDDYIEIGIVNYGALGDGHIIVVGSGSVSGPAGNLGNIGAFSAGEIINIAIDFTAKKAWIRKNGGSWFPAGSNPVTDTGGYSTGTGTWTDGRLYASGSVVDPKVTVAINTGPSFAAALPSGFLSWFDGSFAIEVDLLGEEAVASVTSVTVDAEQFIQVSLTGEPLTTAYGDVEVVSAYHASTPVTGESLSAAVGDATIDLLQSVTVDLGSLEVTVSVSDVLVNAYGTGIVYLGYEEAEALIGDVTVIARQNIQTSVTSDNLALATSINDVTVIEGYSTSFSLTGEELTSYVGDVIATARIDVEVSLTSEEAVTSVSSISVVEGTGITVTPTDNLLTASAGNVTVNAGGSISIPLTGEGLVSSINDVTVNAGTNVTVEVTTVGLFTAEVGTVIASGETNATVTLTGEGLDLTASIGGVTATGATNATATLTSELLTTSIGDVSV